MKKALTTVFLFTILFASTLFADQVRIPGFGTLPMTKSGTQYTVDFGDYGKFDFQGTVNPLDLKARVTIDQLKKVPGHEMLDRLGLKDVELELSSDGFFIQGNAQTKGVLATISEFLKIEDPYIRLSTRIAAKGFALRGELDFTNDPLEFTLIPQLGTRVAYDKLTLKADVGIEYEFKKDEEEGGRKFSMDFTPEISFITDMRIKPTDKDPFLTTRTEFSFNMVTMEIKAAGSMIDTWTNPLGIGDFFKGREVISLTNTALSMGWIPGTPSPSNIGFYVGNAKLFHLNFNMAMDISPTSGKVALKAGVERLTMNDLTQILRDDFELQVPDIFPSNMYLEGFEFLFSPDGGSVGAFEIEKGYTMKGRAVFGDGFDGYMNFRINEDNDVFMHVTMNPNFRRVVENNLKDNNLLKPILTQMLNTFETKSIDLKMTANSRGQLSGSANVWVRVLQNDVRFEYSGSFDPDRLASEIVTRITDLGLQNINLTEAARVIVDAAAKARVQSRRIAQDAFQTAQRLAEEASVAMDHALHTTNQCLNNCVPRYVQSQTHAMLEGSNEAVRVFYEEMLHHLRDNVVGANEQETRRMRSELIKADWDAILATIDDDWDIIHRDRTVIRFFLMPSDATTGRRAFQRLVNEERQKHVQYRDRLWGELMTIVPVRAEDGSRQRRPRPQ